MNYEPNQKINIIREDNSQDTGREVSNIIHMQEYRPKTIRPQSLYTIHRYDKRLECAAMTAKEIDKRAREAKGSEGLAWYISEGYSVKLAERR